MKAAGRAVTARALLVISPVRSLTTETPVSLADAVGSTPGEVHHHRGAADLRERGPARTPVSLRSHRRRGCHRIPRRPHRHALLGAPLVSAHHRCLLWVVSHPAQLALAPRHRHSTR